MTRCSFVQTAGKVGGMEKEKQIIEVDLHLLDLRYGHTRIKNDKALANLERSIRQYGQIVPVLAVTSANTFILIDGFLRFAALQRCGHDCLKVQILEEDEAGALFILLARNNDRQWEVIEQASIIQELHNRFSYSFEEIGKHLARDKSWVKRRLDLVDLLPEEIQQAVIAGKISTWSASNVLVPLSRVNEQDAIHLTNKLVTDPLSTRELATLYDHYKNSNRAVRDRIINAPALFAKTSKQQKLALDAKQVDEGPEGKWLKDITIVCHILKQLLNTAEYAFYPTQDGFHRNQQRIWLRNAEEMIVKLKEQAERKVHDITSIPANNPGDGQQSCEYARD